MMKQDTIAVALKGIGFVGAAVCLQYSQALSQWSNSGEWPSDLQWHNIIALSVGAGFTAMVAFMSGSYSVWKDSRMNGGGNGQPNPLPTKPMADKD